MNAYKTEYRDLPKSQGRLGARVGLTDRHPLRTHLELYFLRMVSKTLTSSSVLMNFCVLRAYIFS